MPSVQLKGIIATMITPFGQNEEIDESACVEEVRYMLSRGVHGISVGGSTGEGAVLSDEELCRLCELAVREVNGRVPVIAGVIRNSTRQALRTVQALKATGIDGLMVTPVHYHVNQPGEEGNYEYYARIAEAADLPIVIYNVIPHNVISPNQLERLSGIPQLIGIKQSGGDIHQLSEMVQRFGHRLTVMSALDDLLYPTYVLGAKGAIVALSAIAPELCVQQWEAFCRGDHALARDLHEKLAPIVRAVQGTNFPGKIKEAIRLQDRPSGIPRSPVQSATPQESMVIRQALLNAGLL